MKYVVEQIVTTHRTIYFSQLLKTNLLPETRVPKTRGPNSIYLLEFSNSNIINCKICSKLTREAPDVVLVSLMLTLNIFDTLLQCFFFLTLNM